MKNRNWATYLAAAGMSALVLTGTALAAGDNNAGYQDRVALMKLQGRSLWGQIGRMAQGKIPFSADAALKAADEVNKTAGQLPEVFAPGSDVADSELKPEALANRADLDQLIAKLQDAVKTQLLPAAQSGDKDRIFAAYKVTDEACDACHAKYRLEKKH